MSEADAGKDAQTPPNPEPRPALEPTPPSSPREPAATPAGGKALAGLALLIGLAGLAAGGYSLVQMRELAGTSERIEALRDSAARGQREAQQQEQALSSRVDRLERLPAPEELEDRRRLLAALQSDMQRLTGRVDQVLGESREEWRLAEAEHLLRMAMLRLSAMQDVESAKALVREADLILRRQDDPATFSVRQKLLEALEALRSLPDLDRTGLFLQLGALRGQVAQLNALAPEFQPGPAPAGEQAESRWKQWLNDLTRYVRVDFEAGNDVKPLLAGQALGQVRLALSLAFEQAQWAVLNSNEEVYRQSLQQARSILENHFGADNTGRQGLVRRIDELAKRPVSVPLPEIAPALQALQDYVDKRQSPDAVLKRSDDGRGESRDDSAAPPSDSAPNAPAEQQAAPTGEGQGAVRT